MISRNHPQAKREQARFTAKLDAIFAQKHADALNPALDAIRAVNAARATERREEYEDIIRGGVEISNKLRGGATIARTPAPNSAGRPEGESLPTDTDADRTAKQISTARALHDKVEARRRELGRAVG